MMHQRSGMERVEKEHGGRLDVHDIWDIAKDHVDWYVLDEVTEI